MLPGTPTARTRPAGRSARAAFVLPLLLLGPMLATVGCGSDDTGLPQQFSDAVAVMQEAGGYSFDATITTGDAVTGSTIMVHGDFQAPNRVAQTVTRSGSAPVTMVLDGGSVHVRDPATGSWSTKSSTATGTVDLRQTFGALTKARSVSSDATSATFTLSGDAARTLAGSDTTDRATVTITLGTVGLSRLTYRATVGGRPVRVELDYTAVGAAPRVTVPV